MSIRHTYLTGNSAFPALKTIYARVSQVEAQLAEMRSELAATRGTIVRQVKLSSDELAIKLRSQFSTRFLGRLIANQEAEIQEVRAAAREKLRNTIGVYERKMIEVLDSGLKEALAAERAQHEQVVQKLKCELIDCKKRINQLEEHPEAPEEEWEEGSVEEPFESLPFSLLTDQADVGVQVNTLDEDDVEKLVELNKKNVVNLLLLESERDALRLDLQKSNDELFEMSLKAEDATIERELLQAEYHEIARQNTKEREEKATATTPVPMETRMCNTEVVTLAEKVTQASIQVETTEERELKKELTLTRHMVEDLQKQLEDRDRLIEILHKERNTLDQGDSLKQIKELKAKVTEVTTQRSRLNQAAAKRISFLKCRLEHVAQSALERNHEIQQVSKLHTAAVAYLKRSGST